MSILSLLINLGQLISMIGVVLVLGGWISVLGDSALPVLFISKMEMMGLLLSLGGNNLSLWVEVRAYRKLADKIT